MRRIRCQGRSEIFEAIDLFEVKRERSGSHTLILVRIAKVAGKKVKAKVPLMEEGEIPF